MNENVFTDQEIEAVVRVIRAGVDSGQSDGSIARAILRHVHGEAGEAVVSNETNAISDPTDLEIDAAEAVLKQAASDWWTNANRADSNPFTLDRTIVRAILRHVRGETGRGIEFMRSEREASRVATREVAEERDAAIARAESAERERDHARNKLGEQLARAAYAESESAMRSNEWRGLLQDAEARATRLDAQLARVREAWEQIRAHDGSRGKYCASRLNKACDAMTSALSTPPLPAAPVETVEAVEEAIDTVDAFAAELGNDERASGNIRRWLTELIESKEPVTFKTTDNGTVRVYVGHRHDWDWTPDWPATRLRTFVERERAKRQAVAAAESNGERNAVYREMCGGHGVTTHPSAVPIETADAVAEAMHEEAVALRGDKFAISVDDARSWLRRWMDGESEFSFDIATIWPDTSPRIRALIGQKPRGIATTTASTKRLTREQIANMIAYARGNAPPSYHNDVPALVREVWRLRKRVNRIRKKLNAGGK